MKIAVFGSSGERENYWSNRLLPEDTTLLHMPGTRQSVPKNMNTDDEHTELSDDAMIERTVTASTRYQRLGVIGQFRRYPHNTRNETQPRAMQ
jgi:hypothetical protein